MNDPPEVDRDIRNISGATRHSHHVTEASSASWRSMRPACDSVRRARPLLGTFVEITATERLAAMHAAVDDASGPSPRCTG